MATKKTKTADAAPTAAPTPSPASPDQQFDWGAVPVTGLERVQKDDLGVPFLVILQKGSPEVDRANPEYAQKGIKGAEAGDLFNNLSREVVAKVGTTLEFIPCFYEKLYVEWTPKDKGGGFIRMHDATILNECRRNDRGQDVLRNGNIIATTAYFYGNYIINGEQRPAIIGMTSTQLKKARQWLNTITSLKVNTSRGRITPPMFSHSYYLDTVPESNEKGSWMGWRITMKGQVQNPALIADCIETAKRATSGTRQALPPPSEEPAKEEQNIPFA